MNFTIVRAIGLALILWVTSAWCDAAPAESLRTAIDAYSPNDVKRSKAEVGDAFFQFEGSPLDRELAARDPALYRDLEGEWMRLLATIDQGRSREDVRLQGERVLALLSRGAQVASAGGSILVDSLLIILRE